QGRQRAIITIERTLQHLGARLAPGRGGKGHDAQGTAEKQAPCDCWLHDAGLDGRWNSSDPSSLRGRTHARTSEDVKEVQLRRATGTSTSQGSQERKSPALGGALRYV